MVPAKDQIRTPRTLGRYVIDVEQRVTQMTTAELPFLERMDETQRAAVLTMMKEVLKARRSLAAARKIFETAVNNHI